MHARYVKRIRLGWRFKCWPWNVPANVVKYISLKGPTEADLKRGEELAREHGWH